MPEEPLNDSSDLSGAGRPKVFADLGKTGIQLPIFGKTCAAPGGAEGRNLSGHDYIARLLEKGIGHFLQIGIKRVPRE
jgi:hypothetical protein